MKQRILLLLMAAFSAVSLFSQDARFTLSPNPANQQVSLTFQSTNTEALTVEFYTVLGNKVMGFQAVAEGGKLQINTSSLAEGFYLVRITTCGHTFAQRLKIQRQ
jgi:hypothetical protein